eukprot:CAMPEP_0117071996 /NCGR_PEP_ID=MMETSP0472-20121206/50634_1 /TAXON_ID=693140 ORGANISM="Tiarina fusus, Strain LIS" /NCGR_SAMPLE_ID=MMETSP0472 /ASSEMBLY_ACC=CAM_ASM_000603 /LENGTH=37 /DNA_ID= /DNA_START= /DNA_END= /DNA_ORIENTATION=
MGRNQIGDTQNGSAVQSLHGGEVHKYEVSLQGVPQGV